MLKVIGGEQEGEFKAVASGTLPNGKPVVVNADGTVSSVAGSSVSEQLGSPVVFDSNAIIYSSSTFDSSNNKIVVLYTENYQPVAVVGTVSGTSISFGTPVSVSGTGDSGGAVVFDSSNNKCVFAFKGTSNYGRAVVGTVSGTSISFGTEVTFSASQTADVRAVFDSDSNKVVIAYKDEGDSNYGKAIVGTVSGTSISFGSAATFNSGTTTQLGATFDSGNNKVVLAYRNASSVGTSIVGTVSGTSISFGTASSITGSPNTLYLSGAFDSTSGNVVFAYRDASNSNYQTAAVGTVSGTSISFGTPVVFRSVTGSGGSAIYHPVANKILIFYDNAYTTGEVVTGTVSGTSISFTSPTTFESGRADWISTAYDSNSDIVVASYRDVGNSNYGTSVAYGPAYTSTNLTAENYIGMSRGVVDVDSQTEDIGSPVVFESADTTEQSVVYDSANNKIIIAYEDRGNFNYGTAVVGTVSGTSISFGTPVVFESAESRNVSATFDSSNNKVVIAYDDNGNSSYGTAVVGTVSGTSISFGSPVVFESAGVQHIGATFDSNSNKVVIAYSDVGNSEYGTGIVGTVSGTTISFGSAAVFESAQTARVNSTFDSSNNKVVIAYRTTTGKSVVGTVSGTSISFGTPVEFYNASTDELDIAFDSNVNKVVIAYQSSASDAGLAKVGTVSGTSISFGAEATFNSANVSAISPAFDSSINKIIISYEDKGNSDNGTYIVGTISDTSISFGASSVFASVNNSAAMGATFDSANNKIVTAYRDGDNSNYGTSVVFQPGYTDITRGEVADGNPASLDIIGSVSDNQLSLTAGEKYYVQTDGTLSTTAGDPSVLAGTAISATKLVVKT